MRRSEAVRLLFLRFAIHADAFRLSPLAYLQAVMWWAGRRRLRARNRFAALLSQSKFAYPLWIRSVEPDTVGALLQCAKRKGLRGETVIPVILPTLDDAAVQSTLASIAPSEESPIVVGGLHNSNARQVAGLKQLGQIAANEGTWFCFVEAGDRLAPHALELYSYAAAQAMGRSVIYADDDLLVSDERSEPHFKSDWNAELFQAHDFVSGAAAVRVTPQMLGSLADNATLASLVDRAVCDADPLHIPAVLHHRQCRPAARPPSKLRTGQSDNRPAVAVIVPTRNRLPLLRKCLEGVRQTEYSPIELIVVNNDSDDPATLQYLAALKSEGVTVLDVGGAFNFSALNNRAAAIASSKLLCFLNNDVEIVDPAWLAHLVPHALKSDIGAVGARLLYPDGTVQHAGVVTGVGGGAAHAHRFQRNDEPGYFMRDRLPQRVSAVTAACLLVEKAKFLAVGGFDERKFAVAFNDVDLCLKLNEQGWQSFYEPRATLIHHESKSRGKDSARANRVRFASELQALKERWGTHRLRDPYHNPNLSPFCEQFRIGL